MGVRTAKSSVRPGQRAAKLSAAPSGSAYDAVGVLTPGCRVVGINRGQFSLLDIIDAVLPQVGVADLTVSTWTPGKREIDSVAELIRHHRLSKFRLLVDRSFVTRHPQYVDELRALGADSIRQTKTHAKFALIAAGDWRITIRTSMNFNRNPRLEQFDLDDDRLIYDFFNAVVNDLYQRVPAGLSVSHKKITEAFNALTLGADVDNDFSLDGDFSFNFDMWAVE
jgi:hypothetical protein